jgi:hypothetical protein
MNNGKAELFYGTNIEYTMITMYVHVVLAGNFNCQDEQSKSINNYHQNGFAVGILKVQYTHVHIVSWLLKFSPCI